MCDDDQDGGPGKEVDRALKDFAASIDKCTGSFRKITKALDTVEGLLQNMKSGLVQLDNRIRKKKV